MIRYFRNTSNTFREGTYEVTDTSKDPSWFDVLAHERHWSKDGRFCGFTNHRQRSFESACAALLHEGCEEMVSRKERVDV